MSDRARNRLAALLRTFERVILGVALVLGLAALIVPGLRSPLLALVCALTAFALWMVQGVIILRIWGRRSLIGGRGATSIGRMVRAYSSSVKGWPLAGGIAILALGIVFFALDVWYRRNVGGQVTGWSGYAVAMWISVLGLIYCSACISAKEPSPRAGDARR